MDHACSAVNMTRESEQVLALLQKRKLLNKEHHIYV